MKHIVLFGATGGIGRALLAECLSRYSNATIYLPTRSPLPTIECGPNQTIQSFNWTPNEAKSYTAIAEHLLNQGIALDLCLCALGALHSRTYKPEKSLSQVSAEQFIWSHQINTLYPTLIIQHFGPLMTRQAPGVLGVLSARVGSISDNQLGGWYSYRAHKAALNMVIKTASIELKRTHKQLALIGIHPGTVATALSAPFKGGAQRRFSAQESANHIFNHIIDGVTPNQSGLVLDWAGKVVPA